MTEILFGTPNSKMKGSLGLISKISTENPEYHFRLILLDNGGSLYGINTTWDELYTNNNQIWAVNMDLT